jgi:hypothetical protein
VGENHWPRINGWLPRGGLGLVGFAPATAALLCSLRADAGLAISIAVCCLLVCGWCAAGLRRDDAAGEVADRYTARGRGVRLMDVLSGQFESQRRLSSDIIFVSLLGLVIAGLRYLCGWGPLITS